MSKTRTGRERGQGKRLLASFLAVVLVLTGMPMTGMGHVKAALGGEENGRQDSVENTTKMASGAALQNKTGEKQPIAHYLNGESSVDGTTVKDSSGNEKNAVLYGSGADFAGGILTLPGGASDSDAAYVEMPGDLFENQDTLTISAWIQNKTGAANYAALYFGGKNMADSSYWLMNPCNYSGNYKSVFTNSIDSSKPYSTEAGIANTASDADWHLYTTVITSGAITSYYDNAKCGTAELSRTVSDFGTGLAAYMGRSCYPDPFFKGSLRDVRVYDFALTESEVEELYRNSALETAIQADKAALNIPDADDVRGNITLPAEGENGSVITWSSPDASADQVISLTRQGEKAPGVVTRPAEGDKTVLLRAKLELSGAEETKDFTLTVKQTPQNLDTDYTAGYLWTYFKESDYEKIYFGSSEDGKTWKKLNKDLNGNSQPVLSSNAGTKGVRDPHLIRSAEGDKYWILGTDLHAEGTADGNSWDQYGASQYLVVWESTDLVNWKNCGLVFSGFEDAGCVWAPEAIYDETTGDYLLYWSGRDRTQKGTEDYALRVYVSRTRDFRTFTEPSVWLSEDAETGGEVNIIDTSITKVGDYYYRFSTSDWETVIDRSKTLSTSVFDVRKNAKFSEDGEWERILSRGEYTDAGLDSMEGLTCYELPDGEIAVMGDHSAYRGFSISKEALNAGTDLKFTKFGGSFTDGQFRHGTVVRLSQAEWDAVMAAYGDPEPEHNVRPESDADGLFYSEDFTDSACENLTLNGSAAVEGGRLVLDGKSGSYANLPAGWMDGLDAATISFDVTTQMASGNFFTFGIGQNNTKYMFFRSRGSQLYTAITTDSYQNEKGAAAAMSESLVGQTKKITLVYDVNTIGLYVNGVLSAKYSGEMPKLSDLGDGAKIWFGKSFYEADAAFQGSFDHIKFYDRALTAKQIAEANGVVLEMVTGATVGTNPEVSTGLDTHTAVVSWMDGDVITSYVRKYTYDPETQLQTPTDLTKIPVTFDSLMPEDLTITLEGKNFTNGESADLSTDRIFTISDGKRTKTVTVKTPKLAANSVLPGQFADPDIDRFGDKYWIFPTTDGFGGWSGTQFHAFSADNISGPWKDEGVILETNKDASDTLNSVHGYTVPKSPWSTGSAWAPSIEEKDGKYYFYYCGDTGSAKAMGVAVADRPEGPYTVSSSPIVNGKPNGISMGQNIDPSVFTDDDGKSYLYWGNGNAAVAELNEDMVSIKTETAKNLSGLTGFRESVTVVKANGMYHFLWSVDDTGSPNYAVYYGTSDSPYGPVTFRYPLCQRYDDGAMLGTAHQSVLLDKDGKAYLAYHRFYTPLNFYTSGLGCHRETCINQIPFDENGLMLAIRPTMEGTDGNIILADGTTYKHKVSFRTNGGTEIADSKTEDGSLLEKPADPEKAEYVFDGWYRDEACTQAYNFTEPVRNSFILYAKWIKKGTEYTVTFQTNGGTEIAPVKTEEGKTVTKPADPEKADYLFAGWYTDEACTQSYDFGQAVTGDLILYAKWTEKAAQYTVSFQTNGGTEIAAVKVEAGMTVNKPADPKKADYIFAGWYTDEALTQSYDFEKAVDSDFTLYAKWIQAGQDTIDSIRVVSKTEGAAVEENNMRIPFLEIAFQTAEQENQFFRTGDTIVLRAEAYKGENREEAARLTFASSDTAVAEVENQQQADGGLEASIVLRSAGVTEITITAEEEAPYTKTITLFVCDYMPKLDQNSISVSTYMTEGLPVTILPVSGTAVAAERLYRNKTEAGKAEGYRLAKQEANTYLLTAEGVAKGREELFVKTSVTAEEKTYTYYLPLSVSVTKTKPAVVLKQDKKVNVFYQASQEEGTGSLTVTGKNALIRKAEFIPEQTEGKGYFEAAAYEGSGRETIKLFITQKNITEENYNIKNGFESKGTLRVYFDGYSEPCIKQVKIGTENKAPAYKAETAQNSFYPSADMNTVAFRLYDSRKKEYLKVMEGTAAAWQSEGKDYASKLEKPVIREGRIVLTRQESFTKGSTTAKILLTNPAVWRNAVVVSQKVAVKPVPQVKLSSTKLTLNNNEGIYGKETAKTLLYTLNNTDLSVHSLIITGKNEKSQEALGSTAAVTLSETMTEGKIRFAFQNGILTAQLKEAVREGSYDFLLKPSVLEGDDLKEVSLKVSVGKKAAAIAVSVKGSLNPIYRNAAVVGSTKLSNINGTVVQAVLSGEAADLFDCEITGSGKNNLSITAKKEAALEHGKAYKFRMTVTLDNGCLVTTGKEFALKVSQPVPKLRIVPAKVTLDGSHFGAEAAKRLDFEIVSPLGAEYEEILLTNYTDDFTYEYNRNTGEGLIFLNETNSLTKGKSCSLKFELKFKGAAANAKPVYKTVKVTLKK